MKLSEVIEYFGSKKNVCNLLDITRQAASRWGYWMPRGTAMTITEKTDGGINPNYSADSVELNGTMFLPATDLDQYQRQDGEVVFFGYREEGRVHRVKLDTSEIYFLINGDMISAATLTNAERLKSFRLHPPYRKG